MSIVERWAHNTSNAVGCVLAVMQVVLSSFFAPAPPFLTVFAGKRNILSQSSAKQASHKAIPSGIKGGIKDVVDLSDVSACRSSGMVRVRELLAYKV